MNRKKIYILVDVILLIILFAIFINVSGNDEIEEIPYSEAISMIESGEITKIELEESSLNVSLYSDSQKYKSKIPNITVFSEFVQEHKTEDTTFEVVSESTMSRIISFIVLLISSLIPIVFVLVFFKSMMQPGGDRKIKPVITSNYSFEDVAGIDEERAEVEEVVDILKHPKKYTEMGISTPKGILLAGEPGTGKTLIAKAIAGEAGVPFYQCAGSSFENVYVGLGASKMRKLFDEAKKNAPSIIFIDEIDAVAKKRYSANNYSEQTLNQLLSEMDGFAENTNVIVIAATNHKEVLDPAITRPGRFDRTIDIPLPDKKGRREILEVHSKGKKFDESKDELLDELAKKTSGMSGAILENIINEAAITAVRNNKNKIGRAEIDEAFIKTVLGISKEDKEVSEKEKYLVSIHEAGHTIVSRITRPEIEILQASIVPRGKAGGYTLFADREFSLLSQKDLLNDITVSLGGRAAEKYIFKTISIGAYSDLIKASKIAHKMVYDFAMTESNMQLTKLFDEKYYNEQLETHSFPELENIVEKAYKKALEIMEKNEALLNELAQMLREKTTLNSNELEELFSHYKIV